MAFGGGFGPRRHLQARHYLYIAYHRPIDDM